MTEELPEGWVAARIGDVYESWGGMTPSKGASAYWNGDTPWLSSKDLKTWRVSQGTHFITRKALAETKLRLCPVGTALLVVRSGILVHSLPVSLTTAEVAINQDLKAFDSGDPNLNEWLAFSLRAHAREILAANRKDGTTVQSVRIDDLLDRRLAVPPLAEQRRIIESVEALLNQVKGAQRRLAGVPHTLRRFRQAVLAAACSGKLTEDWRADPKLRAATKESVDRPFELPLKWTWRPFRDVLTSIRSGSTAVPRPTVTTFPILRSSSVRRGQIALEDARYLTAEQSVSKANYIREGDLLFTRLSGTLEFVGNCARVPALGGRRIQYPDRLFCAKLKDPHEGQFFELVFGAPFVRKALSELAKSSAGHQRISMAAITDLAVPYPPAAEQHEIVRRVTRMLAAVEPIERRVAVASARADALTQSILAKGLRGELVPTEAELARTGGRDYESAEALLARIKAARVATVPVKSPRRVSGRAGVQA